MTNFYSVCAAAAATLVGLLFVAVQIGPTTTVSGVIGPRRAKARSTFTIFTILLALALYFILPYQTTRARAAVALAAGLIGAVRAVRTWLPVWRDKLHGRIEFQLWQTAWLLLGPLLSYAFICLAAIEQFGTSDQTALDKGIAPWFIALFIIGVRNSWDLLVEGSTNAVPSPPHTGDGDAEVSPSARSG